MSAINDTELSALVARKVYRWHPLKLDPKYMARVLNKRGTAAGMFTERTPLFATDPGLALEAALRACGNLSFIEITPFYHGPALYFVTYGGVKPTIPMGGTTVARALCFAALRAVGVDVQDDGGER